MRRLSNLSSRQCLHFRSLDPKQPAHKQKCILLTWGGGGSGKEKTNHPLWGYIGLYMASIGSS